MAKAQKQKNKKTGKSKAKGKPVANDQTVLFLRPDASWSDDYYEPDSHEEQDRLMFSGANPDAPKAKKE